LICIVAFLFLIDYAARMLRPVSLAGRVGEYVLPRLDLSCAQTQGHD
jgi:hypothetical protein